ncbi:MULTISPECIES: hypothetical protein [Paenibacillus]|uniref:Uncharacterized protein n=1 Tax=Paenibacillus odorifer TaxID=189426 RepID=A0AB36J648_9BACL|nr:hypothetical protein [Paenibacillus odorifer]OMD07740.1 hypothetical protein BJP50_31480 [Paenibacillus odorifer]OME06178.1 hypothetical protein BSK60_32900 [Paenibacillus odorifer]OME08925.1 hypothetical protein BSK47_32130 [Paenibacillus odorifer]
MNEDNKEVSKRDLVSWRINKLNDFQSLNKWVNAQGNIQISLTTLVRHMIDRFGYRDITDIDIQKTMFLEPYSKDFQNIIAVMDDLKNKLSISNSSTELSVDAEISDEKNQDTSSAVTSIEAKKDVNSEKDNFYSTIDPSRL